MPKEFDDEARFAEGSSSSVSPIAIEFTGGLLQESNRAGYGGCELSRDVI